MLVDIVNPGVVLRGRAVLVACAVGVMDVSEMFNNREYADVELHFIKASGASESEPEPPAKKPKKQCSASVQLPNNARSYGCHVVILASQSLYWKKRLGEVGSLFKKDMRPSTSDDSSKILHVFEVDVDDLDAAEMLLRAIYTIPPCEHIDDVDEVMVRLRALALAGYFQVAPSAGKLLANGLGDVPADLITDDVMQMAMNSRTGDLDPPLPKEFLDKCVPRLVSVFGNVPAVLRTPDLLARFCALRHDSVLAFMGQADADDMQVHSENDVVALLTAWVDACGGSCTEAQVRLLADSFLVWKQKPGKARLPAASAVPIDVGWMDVFAGKQLLEQFGNVPSVVTRPDVLQRFLAASFFVVLGWASSDYLVVHSENDVVYLLTDWVNKNSVSREEQKQLADTARFAADRGQMITIVSAYSPTEAASDEEAGDFYLRVAALADKANDKRDLLIVAGGSQRRAWDSSQLRRPAVRREFNLQLSDRFGLLEAVPPEGADAQAEYDAMAAAIREVATNHLAPRGSRRRRGWQFTLSQRTLRLMDARQRAHTAWLRSKSAAAKRERNRANRAADAAVQRDRERWIGQQVAEAQDMLRKKNLRQFARACDRLAGRSRSHQIPPAMRDVSGALHSGPDGVLKAMTESFDKLYGGETKLSDETLNQLENDVAAFELTRATEVDEAHGRPPDLAETEACVRALRSAAAPGG
ncbi:hypothetical protein FOA52_000974 [Chlamydomonas sp. UWO 241]|nr:hypothetical protein FOA52_000974 [Chlamydomonas sp. UWO 241]